MATILPSSMAFIDYSALNVALPAIQEALNLPGRSLLWIINSYAVFLSALMLAGGSLGDRYGRKKIFSWGIAIFALGSIGCGLAQGQWTLIISRSVQGIGGALMVPGSLSIITALIPGERRGAAFGIWSTFSALTTIIGPLLGGWLAQAGLWRLIFFINVPLALVAIFVLTSKVKETKDPEAKALDIPGTLWATLGLAGLSYGFIEASDKSFTDVRIIAALGIGVLAILLFLRQEWKSRHPMMPLSLFRSPTFLGANLLTLFLYAGLNGVLFFFPLNLIQLQGYGERQAGFAVLPFALLIALLSSFTGRWVDKAGARLPLVLGSLITGVGFFLLSLPGITDGPSDFWLHYLPGLCVIGTGMGLVISPLTTAVMAAAPSHLSGVASGVNNALSRISGVLAIAILGAVFLFHFQHTVVDTAQAQQFSTAQVQQLSQQAEDLGAMKMPQDLSSEQTQLMRQTKNEAFLGSFRLICYCSVVLCLLSSFFAFRYIRKEEVKG